MRVLSVSTRSRRVLTRWYLIIPLWWLSTSSEPARSLAGKSSRRPGLRLGVNSGRGRRKVLEEGRTEPAFHVAAAVPVTADFFPNPLQFQRRPGERVGGEDQREAGLRIRDVAHRLIDDLRHPCDERLSFQADGGI